ncbi:perosamine synthetase [Legionella quinlivanii]|uniref:GDP-perosamine synthase n=1 Tax=Legionella quinlivanii TaxID=45073 RepID=A0A364LL43_9GAMM|nr:DegT/DnrJ/EryC1/StrS aminotransferase family protein [Legionella quinlivanii]RAP37444.1 perosamine synthetase [Legionella quinlivanii]
MIPVYQPYFSGREKEYVNQCLDSTWISSKGEFISRFEKAFAEYTGSPYATTVSNGTVAIHLALEALGLGEGDEVIVPTLTYVASVNTILQTGATPIYVDSLEPSLQIDPADVIRKITPRTKAVMAVHLYGLPCDMDQLTAICKEHQLYLIEDCAEAFGTLYKGQHVGTFGDVATFSFFGNKTITTGEGGMVLCKTKALHERACHLKNQGVSPEREYWHNIVAYNYRMTNICAAIGLAQLEQADAILAKKREIASWYKEGLANLPLYSHEEMKDTRHSFWMCSIIVDDASQRQSLRDFMKAKGIETRPFFHPSHQLPHCAANGEFPVAQSLSERGINLPSSPVLEYKDVAYICETIRLFFSK